MKLVLAFDVATQNTLNKNSYHLKELTSYVKLHLAVLGISMGFVEILQGRVAEVLDVNDGRLHYIISQVVVVC